ncbi:hypothetical protein [Luteimonas aquatica]|uniref:hypothetical protein n=1 Tax=Luteimonas aquatica TaxID=450364 RepID=UPI001F593CEA|nr:hypothetical protein [Luteimonas aquatica]
MSVASPSLAAPSAAPQAPTWWEIPRLAGRLLWRHWPALLFWYFAQRVAYDLLLDAAIRLAETSVLLSYAAIALLIVTQLAGTIAMFLAVRPSLETQAGLGVAPARPARPWLSALAIALLPFFAYYASWGLLDGVKRDFRLTYIFSVSFENRENLGDIFALHGLWIALLIAWAVREVAKRRAAATGHAAWTVLATVCEAYWVFVGVAAIAQGIAWIKDWWHARVVYVVVAQWWENPFAGWISLAPLKRVLEPAWEFLSIAAGGVVMPLVWLAITAIIYGLDLRRRHRLDGADAQWSALGSRYQGMHLVWRKLADKASAGWTSKGVPVVNSLRLVLRAGLPALLTLCLCWQVLAFVDASAWRVAVDLIGARDWESWEVIGQPLSLLFNGPLSARPALFTELLRIVLLAAAFDRAVARLPRAEVASAPQSA